MRWQARLSATMLLVLPSVAPGQGTARAEIEATNANLERWYAAGQVDSIVSVFAEDAWQMPPNMPPIVSRDSIRAFWTGMTKQGKIEFDLTTEDVVSADSIAVERGRFTLRFAPAAGAQIPAFEDRGNYVVFWRREADGRWRVVWDAPVSTVSH